jgi:alpha-mannosidase/alpha-mannosidase II/lysosomal alpha-mannosidase
MALGILQHHDAVAGTAKQKVTDDYIATGLRSIAAFNNLYSDIKEEEIKKETGETVSDLYINLFWNETGTATGLSKSLKDGKKVIVNFYNPGSKGTYPIRLRVPATELNVVSQSNSAIVGDVVCANFKDSSDC